MQPGRPAAADGLPPQCGSGAPASSAMAPAAPAPSMVGTTLLTLLNPHRRADVPSGSRSAVAPAGVARYSQVWIRMVVPAAPERTCTRSRSSPGGREVPPSTVTGRRRFTLCPWLPPARIAAGHRRSGADATTWSPRRHDIDWGHHPRALALLHPHAVV